MQAGEGAGSQLRWAVGRMWVFPEPQLIFAIAELLFLWAFFPHGPASRLLICTGLLWPSFRMV